MRLVCISDTHMCEPSLPEGDVLIHSGDLTFRGNPMELGSQRLWLSRQTERYKKIIITPGNHDWGFEKQFHRYKEEFEAAGITVLNNSGLEFEGVKFWGSPVSPRFCDWAFNRERGEDIRRYWDIIPEDTNVLITHCPPYGILDTVKEADKIVGYDEYYQAIWAKGERRVGCEELIIRIRQQLKSLKCHIFGHIHDGHGEHFEFGIKFINASVLNDLYKNVHKPIIVEM